MMRSLFSGISGLKSHQTRMDVIGNNIANVNTAGYKSSRATFSDALSQTLTGASSPTGAIGGTNAKQIGLGVAVASIDQIMGDGSPQSTGKNTDLAISGNGFFVMKQGFSDTYYTRDGAFEFDENGDFVLPGSGLYVQGWTLQPGADKIDTTGAADKINVKIGKSMDAKQTTDTIFAGNLDSSTAVADATTQLPAITTTVAVYDAYGNNYNVPILLRKTGEQKGGGCTWSATPQDVKDEQGNVVATVTGGPATLTFSAYGQLTGNVTLDVKAEITNGAASPIGTSPTGATTQTVDFKVHYNQNSVTQFSGSNTIHQDSSEGAGYSAGTLKSLSFDTTGVVTGVYTNGVRQPEAQVAIAQFANASGLVRTSGSLFQESNNSGKANIKTAVDLGISITPGALEMSNVDVANEFADMIVTQRGFQSNSKIITVGDEMLETVINMKR
jgi:flagellar hook protein FlgE